MQRPVVEVVATNEPTVFELRVRLDLAQEPLASWPGTAHDALVETRTALEAMRATVRELEQQLTFKQESVAAIRQSFPQTSLDEPRSVPVVRGPPPQAAPVPLVPKAAPRRVAARALASSTPPGPPARQSLARPIARIAQRITDTLSDLEIDFGLTYSIGQGVRRILSSIGLARSVEWDDVDGEPDLEPGGSVLPWYRRPRAAVLLAIALVAAGLAVGGADWIKGRETPRARLTRVEPPTQPVAPSAVAVTEAREHTNMLTGTPLDPSLHPRGRRR